MNKLAVGIIVSLIFLGAVHFFETMGDKRNDFQDIYLPSNILYNVSINGIKINDSNGSRCFVIENYCRGISGLGIITKVEENIVGEECTIKTEGG